MYQGPLKYSDWTVTVLLVLMSLSPLLIIDFSELLTPQNTANIGLGILILTEGLVFSLGFLWLCWRTGS